MLDRREFLSAAATAASWALVPAAHASAARPEIAFTFDDPRTEGGANLRSQEISGRILGALAKHKVK